MAGDGGETDKISCRFGLKLNSNCDDFCFGGPKVQKNHLTQVHIKDHNDNKLLKGENLFGRCQTQLSLNPKSLLSHRNVK